MSEVKRFGLADISKNGEHFSEMRENDSGNYVLYTDYEATQVKIKELQFELDNKMESFGYKEMKARIEELENKLLTFEGSTFSDYDKERIEPLEDALVVTLNKIEKLETANKIMRDGLGATWPGEYGRDIRRHNQHIINQVKEILGE